MNEDEYYNFKQNYLIENIQNLDDALSLFTDTMNDIYGAFEDIATKINPIDSIGLNEATYEDFRVLFESYRPSIESKIKDILAKLNIAQSLNKKINEIGKKPCNTKQSDFNIERLGLMVKSANMAVSVPWFFEEFGPNEEETLLQNAYKTFIEEARKARDWARSRNDLQSPMELKDVYNNSI